MQQNRINIPQECEEQTVFPQLYKMSSLVSLAYFTKSFQNAGTQKVKKNLSLGDWLLRVTGVALTGVDLLQGNVLLQLPAESHLSSVLPISPIIGQDEVGVAAVQDCKLAERVGHSLVGTSHLEHTDVIDPTRVSKQDRTKNSSLFKVGIFFLFYIFLFLFLFYLFLKNIF